jgi:hypothetical protein
MRAEARFALRKVHISGSIQSQLRRYPALQVLTHNVEHARLPLSLHLKSRASSDTDLLVVVELL